MAFPPGVAAKLGWYVYLLTDPGSGQAFYVGRGRGNQCFRHLQAARADAPGVADAGGLDEADGQAEADTGSDAQALAHAHVDPDTPGLQAEPAADAPPAPGRDEDGTRGDARQGRTDAFPVLERIREVEARDGPVRLEILRYRLSSDEARLVQAATADTLGLQQDLKLGGQRQPASDLGTRLAKRAKFKRDHQVVLLRIGDRGADMRYETVRHDWRIGRRWVDPRSSRSPRWAVIVAGELIVAVYGIERWEPTPLPGPAVPSGAAGAATFTARSTYRHSFIGERDHELEGRYLGRSVMAYLATVPRTATVPRPGAGPRPGSGPGMVRGRGVGAQSQVTYVWCGPHWVNPAG